MSSSNPHFLPPIPAEALRCIALRAVGYAARGEAQPDVEWDALDPSALPALREPRATFVTVYIDQALRGCLGTMEAIEAVAESVNRNAYRAALHDHRFSPVKEHELNALEVHLSILTPLHPLDVSNVADLARHLRPKVDGVLITSGRQRGTFLPSVWEKLESTDVFLEQLWLKAGLRPGSWPEDLKIFTYQAQGI